MQINFREGQIAFDDSGKGSVVVFLHGFLENRSMWENYSQSLSKRYRVICIDLPGHGESSTYGYCHTMEFMADVVMSVLKNLKIRKFYLIGHSMGGYVSMAVAEKFPDHIKGLIMFHSTADHDSAQKKKDRDKVIQVVQRNKEIFIRKSIPNLFNTSYKPYKRAIKKVIRMASAMNAQSIIAAIEGMKIRVNREIVIKFAPYPVRYIIGKKDSVLSYEKLLAESKLADNSDAILLENAGHMGFLEFPDQCLKYIAEFLRKK